MDQFLKETDEYDRLVQFFVENELEFDGDEEVDTDIIRCYKFTDEDDDLIAGVVLAKREGKFIIDGIAVKSEYRNSGIGEILLNQIVEDVEAMEGEAVYLVARAPGFFRKNGFEEVDHDKAPNFFECKYCSQYNKTCHPEIMKLDIN